MSKNADTPRNIGKYQILRLLGSGAYGHVYLAVHPQLQTKRAIKLLSPQASERSGLEEAILQARLEHSHIIQIYDVGRHDDRLYMVAEYAGGGSLADTLATGDMGHERVELVAGQVLAALAHAHNRGVVHRDLKPDNILFDADGAVKVADFGLAALLDDSGGGSGPVAGSPGYMAPEQFKGHWSAASDLWAVGCLLAHMIGGSPPFDSADELEALSKARQGPGAVLDQLNCQAPKPLLAVVGRLMEPLPENRPASAEDAARLLKRAVAEMEAKAGLETIHMPTMEADDWAVFRGCAGRTGEIHGDLSGVLAEAWQYHAGSPVFSSPAVSRGAVFFGDNSGWLTALDQLSGNLLWRWQGASACFAQPVAAVGAVAAAWHDGAVCAFEADSGKPIWQAKPGGEIWAGPQLTPDGVAVACTDGNCYILDSRDGSLLRRWSLGQACEAEPLLLGDRLVWAGRDGLLLAVDSASGSELWRKNIGGTVEASPAGEDARLFVCTLQGDLFCLAADDGSIVWKAGLGRMLPAGPVVSEGRIAVASLQGDVWLIDGQNGGVLWHVKLPEAVTAPLAMTARHLAVCGRAGRIYCLELKDGKVQQRLETHGAFGAGPVVWRKVLATIDSGGLTRLWRSGGEPFGDDQ